MNKSNTQSKQLVGFFPSFSNLAETGRAVMIAKRYKELGGNVETPKQEIPTIGWHAHLLDPDGNIIGLFQELPKE